MLHDKIAVGLIGTGKVAIDWHLPDIRLAGAEVIALADSVAGRASKFAQKCGVERAYDSYSECVKDPDIDVISICTPPSSHREIALAAFAEKKHVYLEKPPALNAVEMRQISEAAQKAGRLLLAGSNSIYFNELQDVKRRIEGGELGEIYAVECLKSGRGWLPSGWSKVKSIAGGGIVMGSTTHRIDQALFLLSSPNPVSVTARVYDKFADHKENPGGYQLIDVAEGKNVYHDRSEVEDFVMALVQFDNGATLTLRDSIGPFIPTELRTTIFGTLGGATYSPLMLYKENDDGTYLDIDPQVPQNPKGTHHFQAYAHLFDCISKGAKETQSPGERAVKVMRIVDAIYESSSSGGVQVQL